MNAITDRTPNGIAMGDSTPRTAAAVADAEKICPTESHKYGYLISFAQMLEIELSNRERQILDLQGQLIQRNDDLFTAMNQRARCCGYGSLDCLNIPWTRRQ